MQLEKLSGFLLKAFKKYYKLNNNNNNKKKPPPKTYGGTEKKKSILSPEVHLLSQEAGLLRAYALLLLTYLYGKVHT